MNILTTVAHSHELKPFNSSTKCLVVAAAANRHQPVGHAFLGMTNGGELYLIVAYSYS